MILRSIVPIIFCRMTETHYLQDFFLLIRTCEIEQDFTHLSERDNRSWSPGLNQCKFLRTQKKIINPKHRTSTS